MDKRHRLIQVTERGIARVDRRLEALNATSDRLTGWRALAFVGWLVAVVIAFNAGGQVAGNLALVGGLLGFMGLVRAHRRVRRAIDRHVGWQAIRREQIARMRLEWDALPAPAFSAPADHPFATDLDITGAYSIHRLLDTTVSRGGGARLLDWLLTTAPDAETIARRQALIRELAPLARWRDRLTLTARLSESRGKWDGARLLDWLSDDRRPPVSRGWLWALAGLALTTISLVIWEYFGGARNLWAFSLILYVLGSAYVLSRMGDLFRQALQARTELQQLEAVLRYLEGARYDAYPALRRLCEPFVSPAERPSAQLRRLSVVLAASGLRANPIFWFLVNIVVPWDVYFGWRLAESKGDLGRLVPRWLDAWYELEALNALATFAYLNPSYTFPRVGGVLNAVQVGHPLIPHESRVCNDFAFSTPDAAAIITGSNMSGKSSFLRTLGVNLALMNAGSVVAAASFEAGLFRLVTCIRVTDSVVDGISYFYAEVRRLKSLLNALSEPDTLPVFFLIDEIFKGTNNRERLIGSREYIRALVGGNGCGLISTHDLDLTRLADELPQVENYHFRETVADGRMVFDHRLRPGPCPTTNALRIMALEGLPVPAGEA